MIDVDRLAATEYAQYRDPERTARTRFGWFVHAPQHPQWRDANQLFDVRCTPEEQDALLREIERCYGDTTVQFRRLTLHDPATVEHLVPALRQRGWSCRRTHMMVHRRPAARQINPRVTVRSVPLHDPERLRAKIRRRDGVSARSLRFRRAQDPRLGGELLIAYLDGGPVGYSGWFVCGGVARYRPVRTAHPYRGRGVATTLIRHVQDLPAIELADALTIFCDADGPTTLYEELGFVRRGVLWQCVLPWAGRAQP